MHLEQHRVIEAWLEANKERFKPGRWYRLGIDITDEAPNRKDHVPVRQFDPGAAFFHTR
jgi:hypothetical protein